MIKLIVTNDEFFDIRVALHEMVKQLPPSTAIRFQDLSDKILKQYVEEQQHD